MEGRRWITVAYPVDGVVGSANHFFLSISVDQYSQLRPRQQGRGWSVLL